MSSWGVVRAASMCHVTATFHARTRLPQTSDIPSYIPSGNSSDIPFRHSFPTYLSDIPFRHTFRHTFRHSLRLYLRGNTLKMARGHIYIYINKYRLYIQMGLLIDIAIKSLLDCYWIAWITNCLLHLLPICVFRPCVCVFRT